MPVEIGAEVLAQPLVIRGMRCQPGVERLAVVRLHEARLAVEPALAVDQDVVGRVTEIARVRKEKAKRADHQHLAVRSVGACERAVAEVRRRDIKDDALPADDRVEIDRHIQTQFLLSVLGRQESQEVAAVAAEGDRFLDGHIPRGLVALDDPALLDRLDQIDAAAVKERRIAGVGADHHIVHAHAQAQGDDVLDHAQVVVRVAAAQHDVARGGPHVADRDPRHELFIEIGAVDPPAGIGRRAEGQGALGASGKGAGAGHRPFAAKRRAARRITGVALAQHRLIHGLSVKPLNRLPHRLGLAQQGPAGRV